MKTLITSACILVFILKGCLSNNISSTDIRQCYWCGPLADQVNKSQRPSPCDNGTLAVTTCDNPQQYCAIVASAPPYVESRLCVKIYQDECYPLYCNTTRSWKMTCPCKGDLCNGNMTDREEDAFAGLNKLVARIPKRNKRDLETHGEEKLKATDENRIKDNAKGISENNNLKDKVKEIESNSATTVEDKDAKIVNVANNSTNIEMPITTATVTPSTMKINENSETKSTEKMPVDVSVTEIMKEETPKLAPTHTENMQKNVTVPNNENLQNETASKTGIMQTDAPSKTGIMQTDALSKTGIMQTDAPSKTGIMQTDAPSKTEIMQNDAPSKTENMQNDAPSKTENMQNDAPSKTENLQNDATPKPENMPKDSVQPSANHENTEKSSAKETNPINNNIERPPVKPSTENKKNNDPHTTIAPNQDMKTNATLPGKIYNNSGTKQKNNNGVMQSSSLLLISILGCKFLV